MKLSGRLPIQEYADILEAINETAYIRTFNQLADPNVHTVLISHDRESELIWYGDLYRILRNDLGKTFTFSGIESDWEVWRRTGYTH